MAEEKSRRRRRWLSAKMRARLDRIGHYVTFGERRPLLIFALMLLVTIAIDLCDSFGIDDATDRMIIELVEKVRGPVYGSSDGRQGQAAIALVLIGNQTLRDNDLDGLPLPYDVQATILANVAAGKPRAILYDVYFPRGRVVATTVAAFGRRFGQAGDPAMQSLADEMRRIGSTMPLLIGPVDSCAPALAPLRDVTSQGDNNRAAGVREVSLVVDPHSPRIYKPVHDQPACSEPLTPAVPGKEPPPRSLDTAAFGLYQAYCATALPGDHSRLCPLGNLADDQRPMALQWGLGVTDHQAQRLPEHLARRCGGATPLGRLFGFAWRGLTRAWWEQPDDDRFFAAGCGYHDAIMAADLAEGAPHAAELRAELKGKMVLIGFDTSSSADRRQVPYYGDVPGVFLHAMALDNLIEWNGDPARLPGGFVKGIDQLDLIQYLGLALSVLSFWLIRKNADRIFIAGMSVAKKKRIMAAIVFTITLTIGVLGGILAYLLSWSLASVILAGILPGGILGLGLLLIARGNSGGNRNVARRHSDPDPA